jgi:hypothetical protein
MFDPKEFIRLSNSLSTPNLSEAQYRTGVGRTLYGIFLWAREELSCRGEPVKATSEEERPFEHGKVRRCFKQGKFIHSQVSQRLGALYGLRYHSDYDLDVAVQRNVLIQALQYAQYIGDVFEKQLFANPQK